MNKKGFTLIELLAVIIILGILMIIAIPSVTRYISDSRKSSYVDTAKEIISGTRNKVNDGKLGMYDTSATYYIPVDYIKTENALKSPYGDFTKAYVAVIYDGTGYKYYWISVDDAGQGVKKITPYDKLDIDDIESDLKDSDITDVIEHTVIGNRTKIEILDPKDETWKEPVGEITKQVPEEGSNGTSISLCNGAPCICRRATTLHTDTCTGTLSGCNLNGGKPYHTGDTITYGSVWDGTSALSSGNALDCDVTGTGNYERFYYITSSGSGEEKKAVLIYYANIMNDGTTISQPSQGVSYYATLSDINALGYSVSSADNYHGPATAYKYLPTSTQWSHSQIIVPEANRQIKTKDGGTRLEAGSNGGNRPALNKFTYSGKVARLLTYQEVRAACGGIYNAGEEGYIDKCNFLLENVGRYNGSSNDYGYWLETPFEYNSASIYYIDGYYRKANASNSKYGIRPVIEILESNISNE